MTKKKLGAVLPFIIKLLISHLILDLHHQKMEMMMMMHPQKRRAVKRAAEEHVRRNSITVFL